MKKRGRRPVTDRIPREKIVKAYAVYKSVNAVGRLFGISYKTVQKILGDEALGRKAPIRVEALDGKLWGGFAQWMNTEGKTTELPRSVAEIAKVSGCTYDQIRCFMYRRRKVLKEKLKALPDLRPLGLVFEDTLGTTVCSKSFVTYDFRVDSFTLQTFLKAQLEDGFPTEILIRDPSKFFDDVNRAIANCRRRSESS